MPPEEGKINNKDMEFVFVSLRTSKEQWREKYYLMPAGEHGRQIEIDKRRREETWKAI